MRVQYFMAGFLVNAIAHRIQLDRMEDIGYPIAILICLVILIAARESKVRREL